MVIFLDIFWNIYRETKINSIFGIYMGIFIQLLQSSDMVKTHKNNFPSINHRIENILE